MDVEEPFSSSGFAVAKAVKTPCFGISDTTGCRILAEQLRKGPRCEDVQVLDSSRYALCTSHSLARTPQTRNSNHQVESAPSVLGLIRTITPGSTGAPLLLD